MLRNTDFGFHLRDVCGHPPPPPPPHVDTHPHACLTRLPMNAEVYKFVLSEQIETSEGLLTSLGSDTCTQWNEPYQPSGTFTLE